MKRFLLIFIAVILLFSSVSLSADELASETEAQSTEMTETVEANDESTNIIRFVLIGGSVIGALCAITLLYKKKDEIRYL